MVANSTTMDPLERTAARIMAALNWWGSIPPDASPRERRMYSQLVVSLPFGLISHFFLIFFFLYVGVAQLAIVNVFSVLFWAAAVIAARNYRPSLALTLIGIEVVVHTSLIVFYLGWGSGVQYLMIPLVPGMVTGTWSRLLKLLFTLAMTSLFIFLYYYSLANSPIATIDPFWLNFMNIFTTASAFILIALLMVYMTNVTDRLESQLAIEHEKSENLLHNILPEAIADRLKNSNDTIADHCDGASILFADVVNFTPLSAQMRPTDLVELLDEVFSDFDDLTEQYGLEKIKTIGDCYMVASGVPVPRADHAQAIAQMALDMQARVENHDYNGHKLAFRIGINSGPVVAGVIGRKKFIYDLWGDAVNTASRMESNGQGGCIQITEATYNLIKDDFNCEAQGQIHVKGKGEMPVWHIHQAIDA